MHPMFRLHGGIPVEFAVDLNNSTPDIDDIKSKITSKTVSICLISPNNPTGVVFNEKSLKRTSRYCQSTQSLHYL